MPLGFGRSILSKPIVAAAGGYTAEAVTFDGTDSLEKTSNLTGLSNGKQFTVSTWLYTGVSSTYGVFGNHGFKVYAQWRLGDNRIDFVGNSTSGLILNDQAASTFNAGEWYHILYSVDLGVASSNTQCYVNDTQATITHATFSDADLAFDSGAISAGWTVGSIYDNTPANDPFQEIVGDMSEFWWDDSFLDLTTETNRRKFITADGQPVDLGSDGSTPTGSSPKMYFTGEASTWNAGTNAGSGGAFTMNNAVTDSSNEPVEF
jgi:hypothetical protein